jgi:hypothetical protein
MSQTIVEVYAIHQEVFRGQEELKKFSSYMRDKCFINYKVVNYARPMTNYHS